MSQLNLSTLLADAKGVSVVTSGERYPGAGEGLPLLVVENQFASAALALQGAHLLSFVPVGGKDVLWLSSGAAFAPGKAIRGGIPLCLPWFGKHPDGLVAHGFARTANWVLESARNQADGSTLLILSLSSTAETLQQWPHAFRFELQVEVGAALKLTLHVDNLSDTPAPFTYAFHTYFNVQDYTLSPVHGLEGLTYIDTTGDISRAVQEGVLQLTGSTDRVYLDVPKVQTIRDQDRTIQISSSAKSAVVWNPGEDALKIGDIGAAHQGFLCVERGDVYDNAITIAANSRFSAVMALSETR
jgi:glucose-6-phosphate 1-epimerase